MGEARLISRRQYSASERERWVELCRKSELPQAQFAREHGLKLSALRQWLYRSNRRTPAPRPVFEEVLFSAKGEIELAQMGRCGSGSSSSWFSSKSSLKVFLPSSPS